jgi:hypothetical protein
MWPVFIEEKMKANTDKSLAQVTVTKCKSLVRTQESRNETKEDSLYSTKERTSIAVIS